MLTGIFFSNPYLFYLSFKNIQFTLPPNLLHLSVNFFLYAHESIYFNTNLYIPANFIRAFENGQFNQRE